MGEHATMLMLLDKLDEAVEECRTVLAEPQNGFSAMQRMARGDRLRLVANRVREKYQHIYADLTAKAEETGPVTAFHPSDTW